MVVQLAVSRSNDTCNTLNILSITGDPPTPAILLRLKLHESSCDNTHTRTLQIGAYGVLFATSSTHRLRGSLTLADQVRNQGHCEQQRSTTAKEGPLPLSQYNTV